MIRGSVIAAEERRLGLPTLRQKRAEVWDTQTQCCGKGGAPGEDSRLSLFGTRTEKSRAHFYCLYSIDFYLCEKTMRCCSLSDTSSFGGTGGVNVPEGQLYPKRAKATFGEQRV